jgi:two-component system sensor histidine kinase RpfC
MGGTLAVRSEVGKGSTFWFDLRLTRIAAPKPAAVPVERAGAATARNILIVDDNETNLYLLRELLEQQGHRVITANSGRTALEILGSETPLDLLLLDYNLGDIDGAAVLQTYRFGRIRPAPAYFLTADASLLTVDRLKATGAVGVLTKPVRAEELGSAIRAIGDGAKPLAAPARSPGEKPAEATKPQPVPTVYLDSSVVDNLRKIGSRPAFVGELLGRAGVDIASNCTRITEALAARDIMAVREAAHALKGVCLEIGAMRLMNLALGIMRADDHWLLTSSRRLIGEISDTGEKTRAALREAVATPSHEAVAGRTAA